MKTFLLMNILISEVFLVKNMQTTEFNTSFPASTCYMLKKDDVTKVKSRVCLSLHKSRCK